MSTILWVSDLDLNGSGYQKISIPLCQGLVELGHNVIVIGLNYDGREHDFPFSIIPVKIFPEMTAMVKYLNEQEKIGVVIVALDLPHQAQFIDKFKPLGLKYICITPLENPPLTMSWAAPLLSADGVYFISETGAKAARKAGITSAEHIEIGVDPLWVMPKKEDRERIRKSLGFDDKFVVITVADNQERKNLWAGLEIISRAKKAGATNLKHVLVTREHLPFGYRLRDFATELSIHEELIIVERGISFSALWTYYAAADLYMLCSKAEGLGLPILESMACGVPVMAADTGAIPELLKGGCGFTIPIEYSFRDTWGNGRRDMVDIKKGAKLLRELMDKDLSETVDKAKEYVDKRVWSIPVNQLHEKIKELTNEQS